MPYMTPLQSATESSRIPKSVMKTIVGGGGPEDGWARTAVADKNTKQKNSTSSGLCRGALRGELMNLMLLPRILVICMGVICMGEECSEKTTSLQDIKKKNGNGVAPPSAFGIYNRLGNL